MVSLYRLFSMRPSVQQTRPLLFREAVRSYSSKESEYEKTDTKTGPNITKGHQEGEISRLYPLQKALGPRGSDFCQLTRRDFLSHRASKLPARMCQCLQGRTRGWSEATTCFSPHRQWEDGTQESKQSILLSVAHQCGAYVFSPRTSSSI